MIETHGQYYFIDMGVMVINDLITRSIDIDAVKGIFITHMHGDHTNGLPHFVDLLSWYFKTPEPVICLPKTESVDAINAWLRVNAVEPRPLQYRETVPGCIYEDDVISVTAIATKHCDRSYAYLVRAEGKTVLFTGDLKHPSVDFPSVSECTLIDLAICESAHFSALDYEPVLKNYAIKQVCINHYSPRWHIDALQFAKKSKDIPVTLANDNMTIVL